MEHCVNQNHHCKIWHEISENTVIQVFPQTNNASEEEKEEVYESLQTTVNAIPKRDIIIKIGDISFNVGANRNAREGKIGPKGIGDINENGDVFSWFLCNK